jgi:hypothetical protein
MATIDISRTFDSFPSSSVCPICRSSKDSPCVLVAIEGTEDDGIVQAKPVHVKCAELFNTMNRNS